MEEKDHIKGKLKLITLFWVFLLAELAVLFFLVFAVFTNETLNPSDNRIYIPFLYLSYIIAIIAVPAVFKIYDLKKRKNNSESNSKQKFENYFFSKLIQFAILEIAGVLSLLAFYLNEMNEPLYVFGIVFVTVIFTKPSVLQFEKDFLTDRTKFTEEIVYMPDEVDSLNKDEEEK